MHTDGARRRARRRGQTPTALLAAFAVAISVVVPIGAAEPAAAPAAPERALQLTSTGEAGAAAVEAQAGGNETPTTPVALEAIGRPPLPFDFEEPRNLWAAESFPAPASDDPSAGQQMVTRGLQVATADVDANGTADLLSYVVVRQPGNFPDLSYVVVQRTDGFGGIETGSAYPFPTSSYNEGDLDLADVDGDGDVDIVVTTGRMLTIETLLNDGDGLYPSMVTTPSAESLDRTVTLGDVDGDGVPDLVGVRSGSSGLIRVYLGNGDGSFRPDATLPVVRTVNVALIDADGDGSLEILATTQSTAAQLWRRAGDGSWAVVPGAMPTTGGSAAWVGDFDGDDDDDVALLLRCNDTSPCLTPLRNDAGTFTALTSVPFQIPNSYNDLPHPRIDGDVVDIDGDGHLDIVSPGRTGEVGVIFGVGDGTFADWRTVAGVGGWEPDLDAGWDANPEPASLSWPRSWGTFAAAVGVVAADLTGDGIVDLASVSGERSYQRLRGATSGKLALITGTGPREWAASEAVPFTERDWRANATDDLTTLVDWDGDGHLDLVAIVKAGAGRPAELLVAPGIDGGFGAPQPVGPVDPQCVGRTYSQRSLVHDLDGDGALDVVCGDTSLFVVLGDGSGGLLEPQDLGSVIGGAADLWELEAADVDGDGDLDIAYVAAPTSTNLILGWAENRAGEPAGPPTVAGFAAPVALGTPDVPGSTNYYRYPPRPKVADVTSDGLPDLVVVSRSTVNGASESRLTVMVNGGPQPDGSVAFTPQRQIITGYDGRYTIPELLDLDQDGILDVVLSHLDSTTAYGDEGWEVRTLRGVGDGTFTPLQEFPLGASGGLRQLADLNGDDIVDLVEPTNYRSVQLRAGNGDGTFGTPHIFGTPGRRLEWAETVDVDRDGDLDVVGRMDPETGAAAFAPHNLVILENLGGGSDPDPTTVDLEAVALEWMPDSGTAADPLTSVATGQVRIQVANTGEAALTRAWTDTVWLSDDDTISVDDTLVLAVPRIGRLGGGDTLATVHDVTVAPHRTGAQHLLLRTDARGEVLESDEDDNQAAAAPLTFAPPELALPVDGAPSTGDFTSTGLPVIVGIPASPTPLRLTATGGATGLAVRQGRVPTATVADQRIVGGVGSAVLLPGEYRYVWLDLPVGATATLTLENLPFGVGSVSPVVAANSGTASFTLTGTGLGRVTEARALPPGGGPITAGYLQPNPDGTLAVSFDLTGAPTGEYGIEVTDGTVVSSLPAAFRVLDGAVGAASTVRTTLFVPTMARPNGGGTVFITFANDGITDVVAPIYRVRSRGAAAPPNGPFAVGDFTVAASVPGAPVGVIPPGASGRIQIPFVQSGSAHDGLGPDVATPRGGSYGFQVDEYGEGSIAPYDPARDYADELADLAVGDRDPVLTALRDLFGSTGDSYLRAIHAIRSGLARGGQVTSDLGVPRMTAFEQAVATLPGASVQGVLTDSSGQPLAYRLVRLEPAVGDLLYARTDGAGRFSFRGIPDGTAVALFLDTYGPAPIATATTPAEGLIVAAPAWGSLTGTVTEATGQPAPGATVAILDSATGAFVNTTARIDGTYRFGGVAPGDYSLTASQPDGRPVTEALAMTTADQVLDLELPPSSTVTGRVVGPDGGAPVEGARVQLSHDDTGDARSALTGADGTFALSGVSPGASTLQLVAPDRPDTITALDMAPGDVDLGDVAFAPGVTVTGTVTDPGGDPVEGATVGVLGGLATVTDAAGLYELTGVEVGTVTIEARSDTSLTSTEDLDTASDTTADFVLLPAALVTVAVTGAGGAPVPDVEVTLTPEGAGVPAVTSTGADGTVDLLVEPGDYTVATGLFAQAETLVAGPQTIVISRAASSVRGVLPPTIGAGGPVPSAGVRVWLEHAGRRDSVLTDETGAFILEAPAGTDAELWVYDPYLGVLHETATFPAIGETTDIGALVPAGGTLTVDLPWMDLADAPLVYIQPAGLGGEDLSLLLVPDASDGDPLDDAVVVGHTTSLELRNLPAGDYRVTVVRPHAGGGDEDGIVELTFDGSAATVAPVFPPSTTATGTELLSGEPLADAFVELTSIAGVTPTRRYEAVTGADGTWSVSVAEGTYRVAVWDLEVGALVEERDETFPGSAPLAAFAPTGASFVAPSPELIRVVSAVRAFRSVGGGGFTSSAARLARPVRAAGAAEPMEMSALGLATQAVPDDGLFAPSKAELAEAYKDRYWPDDAPAIDPQVAMALNRPYPDQPDDECVVLDMGALITAKAAATNAENSRLLLEDGIFQARKQVVLWTPEAALRAVQLLNEVINVVTGVKAVVDGAAKKLVLEANERVVQKMADDGVEAWTKSPAAVAELAALKQLEGHWMALKEGLDATVKAYQNIKEAFTAANPPSLYDGFKKLLDASSFMGRVLRDLAVLVAGGVLTVFKELPGPISAVVNIVDQVAGKDGAIVAFTQIVDLLENLANSNAQLRKSYELDVQRAHDAWHNFLRVGFTLERLEDCPDPPDPPEPPPGPRGPHGPGWGRPFGSSDPNEIAGVHGVGAERWVQADSILTYQIHFENLGPGTDHPPPGVPLATAPAATVDVRLPLAAAVDLATVALGDFGFGVGDGEMIFSPPPGAQSYEEVRELVLTVPSLLDPEVTEELTLSLRATAMLDPAAREVRWLLTLVDPTTGLVHPHPLAGFLPPEPIEDPGAGGGFATLEYQADDAPTGTAVDARARIVFDENAPIDTNTWTNRLDRTEPDTAIDGEATTEVGSSVEVVATDAGSGPGLVDLWRSVDGGPLTLWQYQVDPGDVVLDGEVGQRIGLAARSADLVFNLEDAPTAEQFVTVLAARTGPPDPPDPDPTDPDPTDPGQGTDDQSYGPLPRTGIDNLPLLLSLAFLLLAVGTLLRRRSRG